LLYTHTVKEEVLTVEHKWKENTRFYEHCMQWTMILVGQEYEGDEEKNE
jgi:hypothetical protein